MLPLKEVDRLAVLGGMSKKELRSLLLEKVGITSLALEEETLEILINSGKVTLKNIFLDKLIVVVVQKNLCIW